MLRISNVDWTKEMECHATIFDKMNFLSHNLIRYKPFAVNFPYYTVGGSAKSFVHCFVSRFGICFLYR